MRPFWYLFSVASFVQSMRAQQYVLDTKANGHHFCPHIASRETNAYQQWFDTICTNVNHHALIFDGLRITNIFVPHKAFTHCSQQTDILIETHYDSIEARHAIDLFASQLKMETNFDVVVFYSVHPFGKVFNDRAPGSGKYIMHNQLLLADDTRPTPPYEEVVVRRIALECNIRLRNVCIDQNRIKVSLLPTHVESIHVRQFLHRTQSAFGIPVEIIH